MTARTGILGGTFDPIHRGHVDMARAAQHALQLTEVVLMTSHVPPHRPAPVASAFHRFAMVALAVASADNWRASDAELRRDAPSYTSATLQWLLERGHRPADLFFILGADAFAEVASWKDYPGLLDLSHFAVVSRTNSPVTEIPERFPELQSRMAVAPFDASLARDPLIFLIDAPTADVSATAIRQRRERRQSIAGLVVPAVQQHIERHGLYSSGVAASDGSPETPGGAAGRMHGEH
jgi:nicotinate-nucleotide adenylyltransferase